MKPWRSALALSAAALLSACAVGPDYRAPANTPGQGAFVAAAQGPFSAEQPPGDWWRLYQDPTLDGLVADALANNRDIAVATANLAQVRAILSEARTARLPGTQVTGSAARVRQPNPLTGQAMEIDTSSLGLDVSYEVDLFGRVGRSIEAARAETQAAEAALEVVRVSVAAETARAYADACGANAQLAVAQRTVGVQQESAQLTQTILRAGRGTGLDVASANAQLESTRASIPPLEAARDAALFRLAVLTGRPPAEASTAARACLRPPQIVSPIPVGDGAALLRRRPDVRQAERRLAASTARIGVATASLYPSISLGGSIATAGGMFQEFGDDYQFSVGPLISWTFPNILAARARIAQAGAAAEGALATFEQTNLVALQETETALSAYARELDRRNALRRARDQGARAVELSRLRYREGADSFLSVLDAERTLANLEAQLAQSETAVTSTQITLFKALGGGWSQTAS
ncbi:TolC family protein [Phenylobacterium deserti]|uniref:TolC family protein n=1 Tax=Phenylobacterium deserti TaxID=1914756 RepID=A0A328ACP9_9CAUL|nr:TolC family protein [Phenylobacterium deserti]